MNFQQRKAMNEILEKIDWNESQKMIRQRRCLNCGKKLLHITDETGKKSEYEFWCPCTPEQIIAIG